MRNANRRIVLRTRPEGVAGPEHFAEETVAVRAPGPGEVLLETLYVSVDPAMRVWISENPGYVQRIDPGDMMRGSGIARVVESKVPGLEPGDLVHARTGWQSHPTLEAEAVEKLPAGVTPTDWLGVLGMTGLTAYFGMRAVGGVQPGETVLVSGAAGGVGQIAGQIARLKGCRVVGIAGHESKCRYVVEKLGFDACVSRLSPSFVQDLRAACPRGIDIYFENVGGPVFDAVLPLFNPGSRMTICGLISHYGDAPGEDAKVQARSRAEARGARVRNLSVGTYVAEWHDTFLGEMAPWVAAGEVRYREDIREGFETISTTFAEMLRGENFGKTLVRVSSDPTLTS